MGLVGIYCTLTQGYREWLFDPMRGILARGVGRGCTSTAKSLNSVYMISTRYGADSDYSCFHCTCLYCIVLESGCIHKALNRSLQCLRSENVFMKYHIPVVKFEYTSPQLVPSGSHEHSMRNSLVKS